MKTRYNQMRRSLLVFSGFFLALLSEFPHLYAGDQGTDRAVIEAKDKNIKINEQPMEPDNTRSTVHLVGPSGEEIHIFFMRRPIIAKLRYQPTRTRAGRVSSAAIISGLR